MPDPITDPDAFPWTRAGEHVLVARHGALGRIRLNRPETINALTTEMVTAVSDQVHAWADDGSVQALALDGAGDRGLCAGGDVRAIRDWLLAGDVDRAVQFWEAEYALDRLIAQARIPVAAFMDGVVMGGGIGLAGHASLRLVTSRTTVAMPETAIGFFPDVGALFELSRAPGELGTYLALTGARAGGQEAIAAGLADELIEAEAWERLCARWAGGAPLEPVEGFEPARRPGGSVGHRAWIDDCFSGDDPVAVASRLRDRPEPEAQEAASMLSSRCPFSVALTLEAIRRAARMPTVADVLDQDLRLGTGLMRGAGAGDFIEGVRAVLIERGQEPRWRHASLEEVDPAEVLALF
ncbi:enoyl-CoA hydratase/isomerase family protein [Ruania suaedae]|uniref:enoyl-CoA hydratase/isomerase family protein n=1 Tax=Ruania suaedae TaxID=2897774 RepID=UPI001E6429D0|nr:enoyl-CoA hydratase/isomerase family protein [Ruania suaedae]UFU03271.1 enoyl-CoA hydratase/isomerase family protein [Ruania suaedae]